MTNVDRLTNEQSLALSYAKAFGIILVVIGHYKNTFFNIYHPYLFHMPLFFSLADIHLTLNAVWRSQPKIF